MTLALILLLCLAGAAIATLVEENRRLRRELAQSGAELQELSWRRVTGTIREAHPRPKAPSALVVLAVLAGVLWLDAHGPHVGTHASVFSFVLTAIDFLGHIFTVVEGAVEAALAAAVSAIAAAVSWLLATLGSFIISVGKVFSKVWDGLKVVWNDAIKPALSWVDRQITRLRTWLKGTFQPVFDFLKHVRDELNLVWKRFVKPVLDVIDFVHQLDRLLQVFHITILQGLDNTLQAFESKVQEGFLWVTGKLNDITNVLTTIVTADGFFQRYTFLRTMARDVDYHWRILLNGGISPLSGFDSAKLHRAGAVQSPADHLDSVVAYMNGQGNDVGDTIDAIVAGLPDFAASIGITESA